VVEEGHNSLIYNTKYGLCKFKQMVINKSTKMDKVVILVGERTPPEHVVVVVIKRIWI
jgi:hypothetical protein